MNEIWEIKVTDGSEPLTLEQAKTWLRVTTEDDDSIITDLITVARHKIERYTTRSLVAKTIVLTGRLKEYFPLPYSPINSISQVRVLQSQDSNGVNTWETLTSDEWQSVGYYEKHFKPFYEGVYEITYTTLADSDSALLSDLKSYLWWLYFDKGRDIPEPPLSESKHLKNLTWL